MFSFGLYFNVFVLPSTLNPLGQGIEREAQCQLMRNAESMRSVVGERI